MIPLWFIAVPGPNAVVELWQLAQSSVVGMCPVPRGAGVTPRNAVPVVAAAWHAVQPLVMPLWFITPDLGPVLPLAWHCVHAAVVGM